MTDHPSELIADRLCGGVHFRPDPEIQGKTRHPAAALQAYPSSVTGAFSLWMPTRLAGIRLNVQQARRLADELSAWAEAQNGAA